MAARQEGQAAPTMHRDTEPDVLPVFYYNDLMVGRIGDRIGSNLFEPRYQKMCERLATDPRFLFMPNYQDYTCCVGDVGFVIRLTGLKSSPSGSFGIQGFAEELVAVASTWVEIDTNGLHYAHFWRLDPDKVSVTMSEVKALYSAMRQTGWLSVNDPAAREHLVHPSVPGVQMLLGANWPDRCYLLSALSDNAEDPVARLTTCARS
ncbi:unnamed protein product [Polarella glacialis]|uniref:Uncharacterized protein n=1 Tax=Polarella glacialis TaxID=89957 RepID=A0A813EAZ4_POLGL|nr:unnamed protein product [Polarella glacialis]